MHVLFLTEDFPAAHEAAGGVRVSIRKQADVLATHCRLTVVVMKRALPPLAHYAAARRAEAAGRPTATAAAGTPTAFPVRRYTYLHVPLLWSITEPLQLFLLALWVSIRHGRGVDVIHGHRAFPMGLPMVWMARLLGRPSVLTVYGTDIHTHAQHGGARAFWTRRALGGADRVIAVSQSLCAALEELGVPAARCTYIPSGVDLERFRPPADGAALRRDLGLEGDAHVFLAINLFVEVKGHRHLVDAFRQLVREQPHAYLVMTSDGPLRQAVESQVEEAGLAERVRFAGFLDYHDIPRWVAAADTIVLPSLNEGMPLSILEGFACGKPLVGSRVGGVPELVTDERYGILVPPADAGALATALGTAMARRWDAELLRARATEFSWERIGRQVLATYPTR